MQIPLGVYRSHAIRLCKVRKQPGPWNCIPWVSTQHPVVQWVCLSTNSEYRFARPPCVHFIEAGTVMPSLFLIRLCSNARVRTHVASLLNDTIGSVNTRKVNQMVFARPCPRKDIQNSQPFQPSKTKSDKTYSMSKSGKNCGTCVRTVRRESLFDSSSCAVVYTAQPRVWGKSAFFVLVFPALWFCPFGCGSKPMVPFWGR